MRSFAQHQTSGNSDGPVWIVPIIGAITGAIIGVWSGFSLPIQAYAVATAFDFAAGVAVAVSFQEFDPSTGGRGLLRKGFGFALVLLVGYLQRVQLAEMGIQMPAAESLALAFTMMEVVSILRHYKRIGGDLGPLEQLLAEKPGRG